VTRRRRPGEPDPAHAAEPGFDLRARVTRLEAFVAAEAEELARVRRGFGALLGLLERRMGELEGVHRAADLHAVPEPIAPDAERVPLAAAAERLGRSVATLRRWCETGRLPGARVEPLDRGGRRWTIPADVLANLVSVRERSLRCASRDRLG
jgi:hypothetical protein